MQGVTRIAGSVGAVLMLAGCAQSPCGQPDVLAFVDHARQSQNLDALGPQREPIRQTSPVAQAPNRYADLGTNPRTEICTAWMLSRNPAWRPGGTQPRYVRVPQSYWVSRLEHGYEVGLVPLRE